MSRYLVDHTGDYLQEAARACNLRRSGDMRLEVVARESMAAIRGCLGGKYSTWDEEGVEWPVVATATANPLVPLIDRVLFRLERHAMHLVKSA